MTRFVLIWASLVSGASAADWNFERIVIDPNFPDAYQVEVADIDGDGKPDIVALGGSTCAWYQNPTWKKRIITNARTTPGIITAAARDLDGDGRAEIAIGHDFEMNRPELGKLALAVQGPTLDDPWTLRPIANVPSIHRVRWGNLDGDGRPELVVAPLFGKMARPPLYDQTPASLTIYRMGDHPRQDPWTGRVVAERFVLHAIEVRPQGEILTADNLGVAHIQPRKDAGPLISLLSRGQVADPPKRGASEVHLGRGREGRGFLATIEPWHGDKVVISDDPGSKSRDLDFSRHVIDDTLNEGHALWVADMDGDGLDEVFAGHRGQDHRVSVYAQTPENQWVRTVIDREIAAQDLRGGDLDGDGTPDVVAVGGTTHNVVWYRLAR